MVHFWRVLETWLQPLVCFALLSPPGQCYTDDRAAQMTERRASRTLQVRTRGEFQRHQHQHGWSRVEREKKGRWAARGGRAERTGSLGLCPRSLPRKQQMTQETPQSWGPGGYDDMTSGEHWSAPHKLPSPSQNTLPWVWRQHFHLSPICCPGHLQHPRCPSDLRPQASMCIHRSGRAWAHSPRCHALPVTIVTTTPPNTFRRSELRPGFSLKRPGLPFQPGRSLLGIQNNSSLC